MGLSMVLVLKRKTAVPNAVRNWRCFSPGSEPKKNGVGVICGYIHIIYIWTHIFLLIPYHSKLSVYMYVFVNVYILYFLAIHWVVSVAIFYVLVVCFVRLWGYPKFFALYIWCLTIGKATKRKIWHVLNRWFRLNF